ncbi:hypothetical protein GCM10022224_057300 [Nonomuraea antimicrobica]|uniref:Uncharacterized protein n=1 Tax=Nonomuraea antimicrobica TaxID=561173 RepID=A0ABP7CEA7_9ACTN
MRSRALHHQPGDPPQPPPWQRTGPAARGSGSSRRAPPPPIGKNGNSAIGTLAERSTRYVMLVHLPHDRSAELMREALTQTVTTPVTPPAAGGYRARVAWQP